MQLYRSRLFATTLLAATLPLTFNAQAAACKSLEHSACAAEQACRWIEGYQRADGRQVKAYCRSAPRKRDAADPVAAAPRAPVD